MSRYRQENFYDSDVTLEGLRGYAARVEDVWTEFVDEAVIEAAEAAAAALTALADAIEEMRAP